MKDGEEGQEDEKSDETCMLPLHDDIGPDPELLIMLRSSSTVFTLPGHPPPPPSTSCPQLSCLGIVSLMPQGRSVNVVDLLPS